MAESSTTRTGTTTSRVNLREGPGTNFEIKAVLSPRTSLLILGEDGAWFKVNVNGQEGFVHRTLVLLPTQETSPGFLIHQAEAQAWQLVPAVRLVVPSGGGPTAKKTAQIWNKYGGLLQSLATTLKIDPGVAVAIVAVESGGEGFQNGQMIIRFENHHFWKHWGRNHAETFNTFFRFDREGKPWTGHEFRPDAGKPWEKFHGDQNAEWTVFTKAVSLNDHAAKLSISLGLPQILGSNHAEIGYDSVEEMFNGFKTDERTQLIGLFDFIQGPHTISRKVTALQNKNFVSFAEQYNGAGQAAQYGALLEDYFEAFATLKPA